MTIYTTGNAAKQWILSELHERFGDSAFRVLDLGCGAASSWVKFLEMHPHARYIGYDYDKVAIAKGRMDLVSLSNVALHDGDAQLLVMDGDYDVVTAFSAVEHVVDRLVFLKTVFASLKSGGLAYLNYDDGHFRSHDLKERIMVPVSQSVACSFWFSGTIYEACG